MATSPSTASERSHVCSVRSYICPVDPMYASKSPFMPSKSPCMLSRIPCMPSKSPCMLEPTRKSCLHTAQEQNHTLAITESYTISVKKATSSVRRQPKEVSYHHGDWSCVTEFNVTMQNKGIPCLFSRLEPPHECH